MKFSEPVFFLLVFALRNRLDNNLNSFIIPTSDRMGILLSYN